MNGDVLGGTRRVTFPVLGQAGLAIVGAGLALLLPPPLPLIMIGMLLAVLLAGQQVEVTLFLLLLTCGINLQPAVSDVVIISGPPEIEMNAARLLLVLLTFGIMVVRQPSLLTPLKSIVPQVGFLLFAALSIGWSPNRGEGVRFLLQLVVPITAFCLAVAVVAKGKRNLVVGALAAAAGLALVVNFLFSLQAEWWLRDATLARYHGTLAPNPLGLFSAVLALAMFAWARSSRRVLFLCVFALLVLQLAATGSRTSLVALGLSLATLQLLRGRWLWVVSIVVVGAVVWVTVPALGTRAGLDVSIGTGGSIADLAQEGNLSGRFFIWYDVWTAMISGAEVAGRGLGATTAFMAERYSTLRSTHSEFIRLMAETGGVGLGLFLLSIASLGRRFVRSIRRGPESSRDASRLGLCTLLLLFISCATENALGGYMFFITPIWVILAVAVEGADGRTVRAAAPVGPRVSTSAN